MRSRGREARRKGRGGGGGQSSREKTRETTGNDSGFSSFSSPEPPGPLSRWRLGTSAKAPPAKRDRRLWGREWVFLFFFPRHYQIVFLFYSFSFWS